MLLKGNQMLTIDTCFGADVDRLLGLADQFLDDWAEDAVQGGKPDEDYEQRGRRSGKRSARSCCPRR
jgi:hypothetical protein